LSAIAGHFPWSSPNLASMEPVTNCAAVVCLAGLLFTPKMWNGTN
jgi:hypothetical protein